MATRTVAAAGGNWSATATWAEGVVPTSADDVVALSTSGSLTIDVASACRSFDAKTNSYAGTLTHTAAIAWSIGDATAGANNIALAFSSGMTYALGNIATSAINFASTATTQQTVDFGGKAHGNVTYGSVSGTPNYAVVSSLACDATATITSTYGHLHLDGASDSAALAHAIGKFTATASNVRTINLGYSTITMNGTGSFWSMGTSTNITLVASNATIIHSDLGASATGSVQLVPGGTKTYGTVRLLGAPEKSISGSSGAVATIINYERSGTNVSADYKHLSAPFTAGATTKVPGTFKVRGVSDSQRAVIWPNNNGIPATLDLTGATLDLQYVTMQDMIITRGANLDLSSITGYSSDAGGNSTSDGYAMTFTPAVTQDWIASGSGNWSVAANWSSGRVPLVQDPVVITKAFSGSPTITCDCTFACGPLDFSASTGTVSLTVGTVTNFNVVGSFKGRSGAALSGSFYWNSRKTTDTFTFNGSTIGGGFGLSTANGGLFSFTDSGTLATVSQRSGLISINAGVTLTMGAYLSTATTATAKSGIRGAGTLYLSGTGTIFSAMASTLSDYSQLGRIHVNNTSSTAKSFLGNGNAFNNLTFSGGTGALNITGANSFQRIPRLVGTAAGTITFAGGTTTTLTGPGDDSTDNGTYVATYKSATAGTAANITKANGRLRGDYLSLQDLAAANAPFYAGANSTNVSGNSGWTFSAAPVWTPQAA